MPTILGNPYALDWRGNPPHMLKPDIPTWYKFLKIYGKVFVNLYYDVALGGPYLSEKEREDPLKRGWAALLAKRIDALGETENEVWIIEVATELGQRALGQVNAYRALWLRDPKIMKLERLVLVGSTIDPDLLDAAGIMGLTVYLV